MPSQIPLTVDPFESSARPDARAAANEESALRIEDPAPEVDVRATRIHARAGVPNRRGDRVDEDAWEKSLRAATNNRRSPGRVFTPLSIQDDARGAGIESAAVETGAWVDVAREGPDHGQPSRDGGHASGSNEGWWEVDARAADAAVTG